MGVDKIKFLIAYHLRAGYSSLSYSAWTSPALLANHLTQRKTTGTPQRQPMELGQGIRTTFESVDFLSGG